MYFTINIDRDDNYLPQNTAQIEKIKLPGEER